MKTHSDPKFASLKENKYENLPNYFLKSNVKTSALYSSKK